MGVYDTTTFGAFSEVLGGASACDSRDACFDI